MTIEQLRRMHQAGPFTPFRLHMADGRHLDVDHPESLAHSLGGPSPLEVGEAMIVANSITVFAGSAVPTRWHVAQPPSAG